MLGQGTAELPVSLAQGAHCQALQVPPVPPQHPSIAEPGRSQPEGDGSRRDTAGLCRMEGQREAFSGRVQCSGKGHRERGMDGIASLRRTGNA